MTESETSSERTMSFPVGSNLSNGEALYSDKLYSGQIVRVRDGRFLTGHGKTGEFIVRRLSDSDSTESYVKENDTNQRLGINGNS
jgi:hypothetical protein